jgi:putative NADH-flavin reductase
MEQKPKVAVLGGTGKAGGSLVKTLLEQGFSLKLLLRTPEKFQIQSSAIEHVAGDVRDYGRVRTLIEGCQAVISALGQPAGAAPIFNQATQNVLKAMQEEGIKRYIMITGLPVDTPLDRKGPKTQSASDWMKEHYPATTADKQLEYHTLRESQLDWTMVRLPWLKLTDKRQPVHLSLTDCPGEDIGVIDLAHFLVEQLSDGTYYQQAPFIANG